MSFKEHKRRSIRLNGYDYTSAGAYFITICARDRQCLFGKIMDGQMRLNAVGLIVEDSWRQIQGHFAHMALDVYVVMPNHIHGIITINYRRGTACRAPTVERFGKPVSGSISTVIRSFKSAVTRRINILRATPTTAIWQRNDFERVIRHEDELRQMRQYIIENPLKWDLDKNNPKNH